MSRSQEVLKVDIKTHQGSFCMWRPTLCVSLAWETLSLLWSRLAFLWSCVTRWWISGPLHQHPRWFGLLVTWWLMTRDTPTTIPTLTLAFSGARLAPPRSQAYDLCHLAGDLNPLGLAQKNPNLYPFFPPCLRKLTFSSLCSSIALGHAQRDGNSLPDCT